MAARVETPDVTDVGGLDQGALPWRRSISTLPAGLNASRTGSRRASSKADNDGGSTSESRQQVRIGHQV